MIVCRWRTTAAAAAAAAGRILVTCSSRDVICSSRDNKCSAAAAAALAALPWRVQCVGDSVRRGEHGDAAAGAAAAADDDDVPPPALAGVRRYGLYGRGARSPTGGPAIPPAPPGCSCAHPPRPLACMALAPGSEVGPGASADIVAVLGGSFDPPTAAHVRVATEVLRCGGAGEVRVM